MNNSNCEPHVLVLIFILAVILFIIYKSHYFKCKKYNKLALALSILLFFWFITIYIRNIYKIENNNKDFIFEVDMNIKCFVGEPGCENGNIDIWTVGHFVVYFFMGLYVPGLYVEIFVISVIFECFEYMVGHKSKFIVDSIVNMAGYILGSQLSLNEDKKSPLQK